MSEPSVLTEIAGGVGTITLNRPKAQNSLDAATAQLFMQCVARLEADPAVRVVVLAARGTIFSAGGDFNWVLTWPQLSQAERDEGARLMAEAVQVLYDLSKPTIARVDGPAVGGGVGLVLACDWAIGSANARIGLTSVRNGLLAAIAIGPLIQSVGVRRARQLLLHGGVLDADMSLQYGLLDRVVAADMLDEEIATLAHQLMHGAPGVQALIKRLVTEVAARPNDPAQAAEIGSHVALQSAGDEAQEGMAAFLRKRRAAWVPHED